MRAYSASPIAVINEWGVLLRVLIIIRPFGSSMALRSLSVFCQFAKCSNTSKAKIRENFFWFFAEKSSIDV